MSRRYHRVMTVADMLLAHSIIERIGIERAVELLHVIDGDELLPADARAAMERAANLLAQELGEDAPATLELRAVLERSVVGLRG